MEENDLEVVWAKSARGVWGLGHLFDGKLYCTRDVCEEKWIPKDLVSPKKLVPAPKARPKSALEARAKPTPNRLVRLRKQVLNQPPNQPHALLPPPHQWVPHTLCLLCKLNTCNSSQSAILVPKNSLPFLWILSNICVASITLAEHQCKSCFTCVLFACMSGGYHNLP